MSLTLFSKRAKEKKYLVLVYSNCWILHLKMSTLHL